MEWTSDLTPIDHVFLCQIWPAVDHFYFYRWTDARTNRYYLSWTEYVPNPSSSQGNSSPLEKGWFILERTILQFKLEAFRKQVKILQAMDKSKAVERVKFKEDYTRDLTLHCCACGLREEWNKQEVDEVDEGQGIVPEQASCRNKDTNKHTD